MKKLFRYFKNCWHFRKELTDFDLYDYAYNIRMFVRSIELTKDYFKKIGERPEAVVEMERLIELLNKKINGDDVYFDLAEATTGHKVSLYDENKTNSIVFAEILKLEKKDNREIMRLISRIEHWWV